MKDIVSKFSLYDILAMVIPGGMMLLVLYRALLFNNSEAEFNSIKIEGVLFWTIYFTASYIIGLINHTFTSFAWRDFRNNERMIQDVSSKCTGLSQAVSQCLWCVIFNNLAYLLAYCFVLNILRMLFTPPLPCAYIESLVCFVLSSVVIYVICDNNKGSNKNKGRSEQLSNEINQYYSKYYYVLKYQYSNDIPIMEGQVAFIQNMIIPILLALIFPLTDCVAIQSVIALILPLLILTVFHIQKKIYRRVWEDYEYLHKANEDSDNLNILNNKKITITNSHINTFMSSNSIKYKQHKG